MGMPCKLVSSVYFISGRMEVWEFLSAWSDVYGLDCDQSFLGTINATFKDANVNMRRAMGDIVEDLDAKRRKANASLSKLATTNLPQAALGVSPYPVVSCVPAIYFLLAQRQDVG